MTATHGDAESADAGSRARLVSRSPAPLWAVGRSPAGLPVDRPGLRAKSALRLYRIGAGLAWLSAVTGTAVLVGYATRQAWIVQLSPDLPPMYPNAAVGLLCGGLAALGAGRQGVVRWLARVGALTVTAIGVVGFWLNLAVDHRTWFETLFPTDFVAATTPVGGRPVVETCVAFVLVGTSLLTGMRGRFPLVAQGLAVASTAVGLSAVTGYLLGVDRTRIGGLYVGMALHTGIGIAALGAAALLVRPAAGVLAQLLDGGVSGTMSRRLTAVVATTPPLLAATGVLLSHVAPTVEFAQSVFSVVQVGVLGALVLIPSAVVVRTERQLREEFQRARRRAESSTDIATVVEAIVSEMTFAVPEIPGWDVGMRHEPATGHLAGDSVQVLERTSTEVSRLLVLFDIAGHGAPSAVLAYGLRAHIAALWEQGADLATIARSTNAKLIRRGTIATAVFLGFSDDDTTVHVVNAGHPPPLHISGNRAVPITRTGPILGINGPAHEVRSIVVDRGDLLVLATDGLDEARDPDGRQLGDGRLTELAVAHRAEGVTTIAEACVDLALEHSRGRLDDDALVVIARRIGR